LKIPLVIISASGIGKIAIEEYLKEMQVWNEYIFVISNDFERSVDGKALAPKGKMIHTFNKHESRSSEAEALLQGRENILLL